MSTELYHKNALVVIRFVGSDYTSRLQQRFNHLESAFTTIEDFLDDNVSAPSEQDISLDTKLALLVH